MSTMNALPAGLALALALGAAPGVRAQSLESAQDQAPSDLWSRPKLFGDMGGLRPWLGDRGVTFGLQETSEYLGNVSGGTRRGGTYDGLTQLTLSLDTQKAFGLPGGTFYASGLQIHGANLSSENLQVLQNVSSAQADAATRLWELWYQQSMLDGDVDVKVGQQSLDQEFMVSQYAGTFMNATFGWSALPAGDLPGGGGPAYPLAALGVRVRAKPADGITVLGGVFNGNPAPGVGDPQRLNAGGTRFRLGDGALLIGEVQYAINQPAPNSGSQPAGLPGTYKLGFWYNTNRFADQAYDNAGLSLANPASGGVPATHRGDYSFYAVADQAVWNSSTYSARSVGVFARVMGAPGDRNLIDLGVTAGVTLAAPFPGRDNDVAGLAVGYARIGSRARNLAANQALYAPGYPSRSAETVIEATYQYQVAPWWQMQADLQYVSRPSGGIPNPYDPARRIGNEVVVGLRTVITF